MGRLPLLLLLTIALFSLVLVTACGSSEATPASVALSTPIPTAVITPAEVPAPESDADLAVAAVSTAAGGLTSDSAACLRALYATTDVLEIPSGLGEDSEDILLAFRFLLCLTDGEAQKLISQPSDGTIELKPSGLRCVDDQVGIEQFVDALAGQPPHYLHLQRQGRAHLLAERQQGRRPLRGLL